MDEILMQIPVRDSVKISRKWKSKQRLKEQAVEKNEAEIRDQMDNSLEASDNTSDFGMANSKSKMDLLETDLTVKPLDIGSAQNLSESRAMRNKEKRLRKKMKKAAIKAEVLIMEQRKMDAQSTEDLLQGNATGNVDEAQCINQSKMDTGSREHLLEENMTAKRKKKRKSVKKEKSQDEVQTVDQAKTNLLDIDLTLQPLGEKTKMEADSTQNLPEGNATGNVDKIQSINQSKLDTVSTEHPAEGNVTANRKRKRKTVKKAESQDEVQSVDQTKMNLLETDLTVQPLGENLKMEAGSMQNLSEQNATSNVDEVQSINQSKLDTGSTDYPAEGNVTAKRKKKKKSVNKAKSQDEVQSVDQTNLLETDLTAQPLGESPKMEVGSLQNLSEGIATGSVDEVQSINQSKLETGSTEHPAEGNVTAKRKKKKKSVNKAKSQDEVQSVEQTKMHLLETDLTAQPLGENLKMDAGSLQNLSEGNATGNVDKVQSINQSKLDNGSTEHPAEGNVTAKRKKKRKSVKKAKSQDEIQSVDQTKMNILETDLTVQPLGENPKMDAGSLQNLSEGNATGNVDEVQSINQSKLDTGSTEHEGNVTAKRKKKRKSVEKAKSQDEIQSVDQMEMNLLEGDLTVQPLGESPKIDSGATQNLSEGNETGNVDEVQSINQSKLDTGSIEHLVEGNVTAKRKKKRKSVKKAKSQDEVQSKDQTKMNLPETDLTIQALGENPKMDAGSLQNLSEGNATGNVDEVQSINQSKLDTGSTEHPVEGNVTAKRKKKRKSSEKAKSQDEVQSVGQIEMNLLETDLTVQPLGENPKMDAGSMQNLSEGNVTGNVDEVQSVNQSQLDTGSAEHPVGGNVTAKRKRKRKSVKMASSLDEVQSVDQTTMNLLKTELTVQSLAENTKMDAGSMQNLSEGNATSNVDEVQSINQSKLDTGSTEHLVEGNVTAKRKRKKKSVKKAKNKDEMQSVDQTKRNVGSIEGTVVVPDVVEVSCYEASSGLVVENLPSDRQMEFEGKFFPCESEHRSQPNNLAGQDGKFENQLTEVNYQVILDDNDERKRFTVGRSVLSARNIRATEQFSSCDVRDEKFLYPEMAPITSTRRKLLVLDLNGILADVVRPPPRNCTSDIKISKHSAVFRRPFCDDFLRFCFQNFDVGIWSSRYKIVIRRIVNFLLGDLKHKLLFCWDMSHCTRTRFKTLENRHKPMVFKELRKIWESDNPNLPWKKGDYNESNTLLLDDSPYKALLNPSHTGIFPNSYCYLNKNDNSLGPGGDLRVYLEGLVKSDSVQKYVEQHPFGQTPINESNLSWQFYSGVLSSMSDKLKDKRPIPDIVSVKT